MAVRQIGSELIIKPLNLGQVDAAQIIDHGGQWIMRVRALKERGLLPERVLFALKGDEDDTHCGKARREVAEELKDAGVFVVPYGKAEPIIEFAS